MITASAPEVASDLPPVLQDIANRLGASWAYDSASAVTADLVASLPPYAAALNTAGRVLWSEAT